MAEFMVKTDGLRSTAIAIGGLQRDLDAVAVKLGAMQLGSILKIKASTALIAQIGDCKWAAAHQSDDLGKLAKGLEQLAELYDTCEKSLKKPKTQEQAEAKAEAENDNVLVDIADVIDEFGWLGDVIGEAVDAVVEGAGKVVSAVMRFFQNVSEFDGDFSNPRFWGEWGVETGVEIVKGAVIATGVTGALYLAGISTPGVAIVAAGTVVVGWVADGVYELITGEEGGITEAISDAIVDTGEKIVETGKKIFDEAVDAVEDGVEMVTNGVKTVWNNIANAFA